MPLDDHDEVMLLRERVHSLANQVMILTAGDAVRTAEDRNIKDMMSELRDDLRDTRKAVDEIHHMANRWKGGFIVIASLGGLIGWMASAYENVFHLFKKVTG
jgi:hypothetical protein